MNKEEFNSKEFDRYRAVREDASNIFFDETYDENLYEVALQTLYASENFSLLNEEQKKEIELFFTRAKEQMNLPSDQGKFKLPRRFYLDVIKEAIYNFCQIDLEETRGGKLRSFEDTLKRAEGKLKFTIKADNRIDGEVGEMLWRIYQSPDLSIGVHGTTLEDDFDITPDNCDFFKHGIMVDRRYETGDARRTVDFQDLPGKHYAFSYIQFIDLLNYQYQSLHNKVENGVSKANYSVIVVRPSSMKETGYQEDCPENLSIVSPPTTVKTNSGYYLSGHLVKPEFILGLFKNNESFVRNPKCDLDKLSALNGLIEQRNQEMQKGLSQQLKEETASVPADKKRTVWSAIKGIFGRSREENNNQKGDRNG